MIPLLAAAALVVFVLKVYADQRAYERALRSERRRFDDWCDR